MRSLMAYRHAKRLTEMLRHRRALDEHGDTNLSAYMLLEDEEG